MTRIVPTPHWDKIIRKIKDKTLKERIVKQLERIKQNPDIGKPMMYSRKGTREVYLPPFRLSYAYIKEHDEILLLDFYHKNEQ